MYLILNMLSLSKEIEFDNTLYNHKTFIATDDETGSTLGECNFQKHRQIKSQFL